MNLKQKTLVAAMLGALPAAHADFQYNWTESGSLFGNGSGTLTVDPTTTGLDSDPSFGYNLSNSGWDYTVTSISGTLDGQPVSTPVPFALNYFNLSTATGLGTVLGAEIEFSAGGNIYILIDSPSYAIVDSETEGSDGGGDAINITPVEPAAAPEPAQVVSGLVLTGLGGVSLLARRMRSRK